MLYGQTLAHLKNNKNKQTCTVDSHFLEPTVYPRVFWMLKPNLVGYNVKDLQYFREHYTGNFVKPSLNLDTTQERITNTKH